MKNGFRVKGYRSPGYKLQEEQTKIKERKKKYSTASFDSQLPL